MGTRIPVEMVTGLEGSSPKNAIALMEDTDLNAYRHHDDTGWYYVQASDLSGWSNLPPDKVKGSFCVVPNVTTSNNSEYPEDTSIGVKQFYFPYNTDLVWTRTIYGSAFTPWASIGANLNVYKDVIEESWDGGGQKLILLLSRTGNLVSCEITSFGGSAVSPEAGAVLPVAVPMGFRASASGYGRVIGKINSGDTFDNSYNIGYALQQTTGELKFFHGNAIPFVTLELSGQWVTDDPFPYELAYPTVREQLEELKEDISKIDTEDMKVMGDTSNDS